MKTYEYTVSQITSRNKRVEILRKVAKSDLSSSELYKLISNRYIGLDVSITEVINIEEIKADSQSRGDYISYEHMYQSYVKFRMSMELDTEEYKEMLKIKDKLDNLQKTVLSQMRDKVNNNIIYSQIEEKSYKIDFNSKDKLLIEGRVKVSNFDIIPNS